MKKLLIVDDDKDIRQQLKWGFHSDFKVVLASDVDEALDVFRQERPGVVLLDLGLLPESASCLEGFRCLEEMLRTNPAGKVIMLTGNNEHGNALKAIRMGAFDFYAKPPVLSELRVIVTRAFHLAEIDEQNFKANPPPVAQSGQQWGMVGNCQEMQTVFTTIQKVAGSNAPILITGENGTGKELVASAIHDLSLRRRGPFTAINCGAIPESLLESELFGYEKGAFTGANFTVPGRLQYAQKGTLFLDEIGELPVNLQVKLLRFLQQGTIQRVGGREDICIDARTVCATNVDIAKAIKEGHFREDLYYRIGVINIEIPPLRDRGDDILILAETFLEQFCRENGKKKKLHLSVSALAFLRRHSWPGNVRELRNRVQRAVIMCEGSRVSAVDLGCEKEYQASSAPSDEHLSLREARERMERDMILNAIQRQSGNLLKVAQDLGVSRPTLYDMMKKLSIRLDGVDSRKNRV